jgi:FkbM family methyltransferase
MLDVSNEEALAVDVSNHDLSDWCEGNSFVFSFALFLSKQMPRGKGWFPRRIGRLFGANMKTVIRTASGALVAVDPENLDVYAVIARTGGYWEKHVLSACRRLLRPGDVFYDIGANAGFFSIELSNLFSSGIRVCAFEPQLSHANCLAISARLNDFGNLETYQVMLGDEEGESELFVPAHSIHASAVSRQKNAESVTCRMYTIDGLVRREILPKPDVIKMDVEGGEIAVLRGAEQVIHTHSPAIVFESDVNMVRFGYDRQQIMAYLSTLSPYEFSFATNDADGTLVPIGQDNIDDMSFDTIVALPGK